MIPEDCRRRIRRAIHACDRDGFTEVLVAAVIAGQHADELEQAAKEELAQAGHDVRHWWTQEPCDCMDEQLRAMSER